VEQLPEQSPGLLTTQRVALWVAILGGFITPFMGAAINIALPSMGQEFALDAIGMNWVATSYLLAAAMFLLPFGKWADIYGRKKVYAAGMFLYFLTSLLCAWARSGFWLIVFRVLQGAGGAMIFGTGIAILTSVIPPQARGRALGISTAATYLGLSLGPVAGGFMTQHWGWRSVFWAMIPMCLAVLWLVIWKLKGEWAEAREERFDYLGSLIYSVSLVVLIFGFSRLPGLTGAYCIAASVLGFLVFVKQESQAAFPIVDLALFKTNRIFAFSSLAALINYSATFAVGFLLSLYLQYIQGLSPQQAGLVLMAQPLFMAGFSPLAGRFSDRIEARLVASLGMGLTSVGMLLLLLLGAGTPLVWVVLSLICIGLGFALFSSPNTNAVMGSVERRVYGVAAATLGTMRLTGQMLSMAITMLVMALYFGKAQITPALHGRFLTSMRVTFAVFSALCLAGVFASLARGGKTRQAG
jgi:EmrB/QacA subfamily drug resistance transporter